MVLDLASITVRMSTKQARSAFNRLKRRKGQTERKQKVLTLKNVRRKLKSRVVQIAGGLGGFNTVRRITSSGHGDPWAAALNPIEAAVQHLVDETLGYSARANRITSLQVAAAHEVTMGRTGSDIHAKQMYQNMIGINTEIETGRNIFRSDPRFAGPTLDELIKQAFAGYFKLLGKSFSYMGDLFDGK